MEWLTPFPVICVAEMLTSATRIQSTSKSSPIRECRQRRAKELAETDFDQIAIDLIKQMNDKTSEELQDDVHRMFDFHVCRPCQQTLLANPLGRPESTRGTQLSWFGEAISHCGPAGWNVIVYRPGGHEVDLKIFDGNLLDQDVDVIVNAWNRNIIPWWLLLPQGVSGAIERRAGYGPSS